MSPLIAKLILIAGRGFDLLHDQIVALPPTESPAADLVEAGVTVFRRFAIEHPSLFRISIQRALPEPDLAAGFLDAGRAALAQLEALIARLEAGDLLGGRVVHDVACEFHSLCEGLAAMELRSALRRGEEERIWRDALTALVQGFGATAAR